MVLISISIHS